MLQFFHMSGASRFSQHMTKADGQTGCRFGVLGSIIRWLTEWPRKGGEPGGCSQDYGPSGGESRAIVSGKTSTVADYWVAIPREPGTSLGLCRDDEVLGGHSHR